MYIQEWRQGCRITVSDWIGKDSDGKTPIRVGVEYFKPGAAICRPEWERVIYCPRKEENTIKNYLDSIVCAICSGAIPSALSLTQCVDYELM